DHIGGITAEDDIPFPGLRVEPIDVADTAAFGVLWQPDHSIGGINQDLVNVILGMGREPLVHLAGAGIELDEPPWSASVGSVHVAFRIEPYILEDPPARKAEGAGILRRMDALAGPIRGDVVLH